MTRFRHDLTPDEPVVLDAGYEFDKAERRRIDEQIRDLQRAALDGFMRGTVTAYFVAAADLARGDVVCLAGSTAPGGERRVTKATAAAMASAGTPVGIVMADAPKGASVRVAIAGVVPATVTGLLAGEPGFVRVSSIGRCERVATPAGGDVLLGSIDAAGTLAMAHGRGGTGGGGGGDVELDGEVTGPASATVVAKVGGAAVAFDDTETGYLAVEDGEIVAKSPPVPTAADIPFDPSGTGLSATDVQGAIVDASGLLAHIEIELPTDGNPVDEIVYTVPACKAAVISRILVVVSEPLVGAGGVTVRAGSTAGGDGYLIDQPITSASEGIIAGESIASLGTLFPAATGYEAVVSEGDEIHVRLTPSGEVAGGKVKVYVCGTVLT